ncbi:MAG: hypothetical protein ACPG8W_10715 [Candidatus Promineifilaceae bacterium]
MSPQIMIGSPINQSQAVSPKQIEAIYHVPDALDSSQSAETYVVLTSNLSVHQLTPLVQSIPLDVLHVVWPDAWPIVQQTAPALRRQMGDDSAELHLWEQGHLASQLLDASAKIATRNLPKNERPALEKMLRDAACKLGVDTTLPFTDLLVAASAALDAELPENTNQPTPDAPDCLPQLIALYEEIDTAILVIDNLSQLADVDWPAVQTHFKQFPNLIVTSKKQLHLLAHTYLSVALGIGRYRLQVGHDLTSALVIPTRTYLLNAAQTVLEIYTQSLPCGVLVSAESDFGKLIHDIQNQLLKGQFQYELLNMMFDISNRSAPRLHSDRTVSFRKRIDNIVAHLQEWVALYTALLDANA